MHVRDTFLSIAVIALVIWLLEAMSKLIDSYDEYSRKKRDAQKAKKKTAGVFKPKLSSLKMA